MIKLHQIYDLMLEEAATGKIKVHFEIPSVKELEIGTLIGTGASGVVYKGKYNNQEVAIKIW